MANGKKVKARMDDLGITVTELAKMLETNKSNISQLVNGHRKNLTENTLYKLCDILQCKPEDIR